MVRQFIFRQPEVGMKVEIIAQVSIQIGRLGVMMAECQTEIQEMQGQVLKVRETVEVKVGTGLLLLSRRQVGQVILRLHLAVDQAIQLLHQGRQQVEEVCALDNLNLKNSTHEKNNSGIAECILHAGFGTKSRRYFKI
jgi:hypothetical protein